MIRQSDRELLEELESLGEVIEWLENRNCDVGKSVRAYTVDDDELREWLKKPSLELARSLLKKKRLTSA